MKVKELTAWLENKYPAKAAEHWDNVGLLVGDDETEVSHVFLALDLTEETLEEIRQLSRLPKAVAIGEIGLDYYWHKEEREHEIQKKMFRAQMEIAREEKIPPYMVFSDKTLIHMCILKPGNEEEMLNVTGVGRHKYEKYGKRFIDAVKNL